MNDDGPGDQLGDTDAIAGPCRSEAADTAAADRAYADWGTVFTNAKAGMEGISEADKERIKKVWWAMLCACWACWTCYSLD